MIRKTLLILVAVLLLSAFVGTLWFLWAKSQEEPIIYQSASPFLSLIHI